MVNADSKYWIYAPGPFASFWNTFQNDRIMGLGWNELNDLSVYSTRDEMQQKMVDEYHYSQKPTNNSLATWQFANDIHLGDIVFVKEGTSHVIGRGIVQSDYIYDANRTDYKHIHKIDWTHSGRWHMNGLPRKSLTELDNRKRTRLEALIMQEPSEHQPRSQKICIICWNKDEWKRPPEERRKHGGYVGKNGFGHEDWLNRTEWLLNGYDGTENDYHYAHLQGVLTPTNKYNGEILDILLCSQNLDDQWLAVGRIHETIILDDEEAQWASRRIIENQWLDIMRGEVIAAGGNPDALPQNTWDGESGDYAHFELVNVKYRPNKIEFFQEPIPYPPPAKRQGKAYEWSGKLPSAKMNTRPLYPPKSGLKGEWRLYSEDVQKRRATTGKEVSPRQAPIQNQLVQGLDKRLKQNLKGQVSSEFNRVDIVVSLNNGKNIFIEIKCTDSVRMSIRLALGQLLEYAHFPNEIRAEKLVVITDQAVDPLANDYTAWLRKHYQINVHLMQFDPITDWSDQEYEELLEC